MARTITIRWYGLCCWFLKMIISWEPGHHTCSVNIIPILIEDIDIL